MPCTLLARVQPLAGSLDVDNCTIKTCTSLSWDNKLKQAPHGSSGVTAVRSHSVDQQYIYTEIGIGKPLLYPAVTSGLQKLQGLNKAHKATSS